MTDRAKIERKLASMWPDPEAREAVRAQLQSYGHEPHEMEPERVQLAILKLSQGRADRVVELVRAAKQYRAWLKE